MNSTTVKQVEAVPTRYPFASPFWNVECAPEDNPPNDWQIWQRIESYIAYRYTPRQVVWTVEGEGDWTPPLAPTIVDTVQKWESGAWVSVSLPEGPYGYCLPSDGPYRITATVGGGEVPASVEGAFKRLHEYTRGIDDNFKNEAAMRSGYDTEYVANWAAKSLQLSGAADLLRNYRRAQ